MKNKTLQKRLNKRKRNKFIRTWGEAILAGIATMLAIVSWSIFLMLI